MYLNGGLEPSEESYIYKNYGLKLKIVIQDDFQAGRAAFKNGNIDIIYCTADAFPVEMSEGSDMNDAKFFNISNWSRGADAIVVNKNVSTVADLMGKIVACSEGTASHTLLLNTLETNGFSWEDVNTDSNIKNDKVNLKIVGSGLDAAAYFKAGQCDAAVVFSPDDQDIVNSISGSKVLVSTKQASSIICDGLIAKASYLEENFETVRTLISALFEANVLMNTDPKAVAVAAKAFAKAYGTDEEFAIEGSKNIYYTTLGDAGNFFGLNTSYTGIKGDELYSKMSRTYEGLNLCKRPLSWRKASELSIIESLIDNPTLVKGNQNAEKVKEFTAPTEELDKLVTISTKKLTIEFPVNSDILDNNAKALIDREFVGIAKEFSGARIRIEGNTDNTGSVSYNIELSRRRAQSVANYLIKEYGFDKNRFIVVGNGPSNAIRDNVVGSNQSYRTTDFQLVTD
jgi:NitT/TauT family transport system substrate-binding protein